MILSEVTHHQEIIIKTKFLFLVLAPEPSILNQTFLNIKPEEFVVLKKVMTNMFQRNGEKRDFNNLCLYFCNLEFGLLALVCLSVGGCWQYRMASRNNFLQCERFLFKVRPV